VIAMLVVFWLILRRAGLFVPRSNPRLRAKA